MSRIFLALKLPDSFLQELAAWRMQHAEWPVRWVRPADLHLTLLAPWETDNIHQAVNTLQSLNGFMQKQTLTFDTIHFIHPEDPRMLWAEAKPTAELNDLKNRMQELFGTPIEEQAFRPHITLARCYAEDVVNLKDKIETIQWTAELNAVTLLESRRDHFGSRYQSLGEVSA